MELQRQPSAQEFTARRKYPRRAFGRKIGILSEGRYWIGQAVEISEGGMSFEFGQKLSVGKLLVVNFQLAGRYFVSVQAEVRSVVPRDIQRDAFNKGTARGLAAFTHGIQFKTLKIESRRFVRQFVSAQF